MGNPPPPNAYPPGTVLTVGSHKAMIVKYISEGGFAHVYIVKISPYQNGQDIACLKRVLVPNKQTLNILRAEVDAMKRLQGKPCIVNYIDSHAARSPGNDGTYEVFLLMEYCSKNGLIDFLNTRLQNRLLEEEVLQIMYEVTVAVSQVHFLNPPLIHRDIKIENILINEKNEYRLCDFGSSCPPLRPPRNQQEFEILQNDILRYTTAQYRSPEMIDLTRGLPIDEKSDIWALGVFCYKICYYTTPFEQTGEVAILQSRFEFPAYPPYSSRVKNLISVLLTNDARARPNIYQVLEEVCKMKGVPVPYEIQQQYTTYKQQKQQATQQQLLAQQQMLQQQKQQQLFQQKQLQAQLQQQQQQQTASAAALIKSQATLPLQIPTPISGQSSGTGLPYNDALAKSSTSIKSAKSAKSAQSGQSLFSLNSVNSSSLSKPNLPQAPALIHQKPLSATTTTYAALSEAFAPQQQVKNKSTPALSQKKSADPFADLIAPIRTKASAESETTTKKNLVPPPQQAAAPKVTPFKPLNETTTTIKPLPNPPAKPKRPLSVISTSAPKPKNDLSLEVIDVDLQGIRNKFENKAASNEEVVSTPRVSNNFERDLTGSSISKNYLPYDPRKQLSTTDVRRSQSFHKRTISAGKTGLNKLTNSFTGKFRSSSSKSNSRRSSAENSSNSNSTASDIDKSEDELIAEISMKEFKDVDYLKNKLPNSVQKRMTQLLSSNKEEIVKTATGYGKYTETDDSEASDGVHSELSSISAKANKFSKPIANKRNSFELLRSRSPIDFSRVYSNNRDKEKEKENKKASINGSSANSKSAIIASKTAGAATPSTTAVSVSKSDTITRGLKLFSGKDSVKDTVKDSSDLKSKPKAKTPPLKKKAPPPRPKKPAHLKSPKIKQLSSDWKLSSSAPPISPIKPKAGAKPIIGANKKENAFFEDDGVIVRGGRINSVAEGKSKGKGSSGGATTGTAGVDEEDSDDSDDGDEDDESFDVNDFEKSFNEKFPRIP